MTGASPFPVIGTPCQKLQLITAVTSVEVGRVLGVFRMTVRLNSSAVVSRRHASHHSLFMGLDARCVVNSPDQIIPAKRK
jgi:hypothetical protein